MDDNNGIFVFGFIVGAIALFVLCCSILPTSDQQVLDKFKEPVCVETVVGTDTIKRCYKLQEVK